MHAQNRTVQLTAVLCTFKQLLSTYIKIYSINTLVLHAYNKQLCTLVNSASMEL